MVFVIEIYLEKKIYIIILMKKKLFKDFEKWFCNYDFEFGFDILNFLLIFKDCWWYWLLDFSLVYNYGVLFLCFFWCK